MKLKKRSRTKVYDQLYRLASKILEKSSACATCPLGPYTGKAQPNGPNKYTKNWCCGGCPHLGPNGCTVKALGCKLWLCGQGSGRVAPKWRRRLEKLQYIATHYDIHLARASKKQSLLYGGKIGFWDIYYKDSKL